MTYRGRWLWLLLLIPLGVGLARLRLDVDVFNLLPPSLETVQGLKLHQEHFASSRELIITIEAPDPEAAEQAARKVAGALREKTGQVREAFWQAPWMEHPEQTAALVAYAWLNQEPARFRELAQELSPENLGARLAATRERLAYSLSPDEIARGSYDPYGLTDVPGTQSLGFEGDQMFGSEEGSLRLVFVQAAVELDTYRQCQEWLEGIRTVVQATLNRLEGGAQIKTGYTGRPAFVAEVAADMEKDMTVSAGATALIISVLFWLAHRRLKPMLWLLALLGLVLASTLALGGLIFGAINVVSLGFAAILLGLAVDYAVVHYQEAKAHPHLSIPEIRRAIAPSVFWAASTTIAAFALLNLGGLPGLGQLGTLVALGVGLAATIMVFEYLPPLFPERRYPSPARQVSAAAPAQAGAPSRLRLWLAGVGTLALLAFSLALVATGLPTIDTTAKALRPRSSPAYETLERIQHLLTRDRDPLWMIVEAPSLTNLNARLEQVGHVLNRAVTNGLLAEVVSPAELLPRPGYQETNKATAGDLAQRREELRQAAVAAGFTAGALAYTDHVLDAWQASSQQAGIFWPTNALSEWIFQRFLAKSDTNVHALLFLNPAEGPGSAKIQQLQKLRSELPREGVWLSGWEMLGQSILEQVQANVWKITIPMVLLVLLSLWLAFRRLAEMLLSLSVLGLSILCLLATMRVAGWSWNLMNLMAVPLVLGTGVDYGIFMQLALRRYGGSVAEAYRSVGRALLLCGGTAITGFAALGFSSNAGMASLGRVCAAGIAGNMLISILLLPTWWQLAQRRRLRLHPEKAELVTQPSSLYRADLWRWGMRMVRFLPVRMSHALSRAGASLYFIMASYRRQVLERNLLPALNNDPIAAGRKARELVLNFAQKLIDLWRYEGGMPIEDLFGDTSGWEHFAEAQSEKRGVLLLTPHLGNWEFGGPWLARRGVRLQVITLSEPGTDDEFTRLRQDSRARWNIETLVIRNDPFAFLEIIRRLEDGATVALLVDRPPPPTAVTVELFGRPFSASMAAAELARASGCVLLPVYLPRVGDSYQAHILPPVPYERARLRDRLQRQELTQQIMRAFEPVIARHIDQWYHFVPVWPDDERT